MAFLTVLALAACGGSGGSSNALRPAPPGTELPVVGYPAGAGPEAGAGAGVPIEPRGTDGTAFCQDVQQLRGLASTLLQPGSAAGALERAKALVNRLEAYAPGDIRPAAQELAQVESRVVADLSANPPDLADAARALSDPGYGQSLQQVVLYATSHCR